MNQNNPSPFHFNVGALAANKYGVARGNLLLVVILTVVNIILCALNANWYMLFSASVPYAVIFFASAAVYYPEESGFLEMGFEPVANPTTFLIVAVVIALILTVPYLLCWAFSKKHYGWMIGALVMFSLDTICMFLVFSFDLSMIIDLLVHAWVLYYLIMGVKNGITVKKAEEVAAKEAPLSADFTVNDPANTYGSGYGETTDSGVPDDGSYTAAADSPILRSANQAEGKKVKVYVEADYRNHHIVYRRVGKVEELVVDGAVYGELARSALAQRQGGCITAQVDGLAIEAGFYQSSSIITVNGQTVASTVRWI